jgi:hypothetical protein
LFKILYCVGPSNFVYDSLVNGNIIIFIEQYHLN